MLVIERVGIGAVAWISAIVAYSAFMANGPEKTWMMSFGNAALNIISIWLMIAVLKALRSTKQDLQHTRAAMRDGSRNLGQESE